MTSSSIKTQLSDLSQLFAKAGRKLTVPAGASSKLLGELEARVGFELSDELRMLWQIANGTPKTPLLCVDSDSSYGFHSLLSVQRAYKEHNKEDLTWDLHGGYPEICDPRTRFWFFEHSKWLPIGYYPLSSNVLYFDAAPGPEGRYGQVILWDSSEDDLMFVADSVGSLLENSLTAMTRLYENEPDELQHAFEFFETPKR